MKVQDQKVALHEKTSTKIDCGSSTTQPQSPGSDEHHQPDRQRRGCCGTLGFGLPCPFRGRRLMLCEYFAPDQVDAKKDHVSFVQMSASIRLTFVCMCSIGSSCCTHLSKRDKRCLIWGLTLKICHSLVVRDLYTTARIPPGLLDASVGPGRPKAQREG